MGRSGERRPTGIITFLEDLNLPSEWDTSAVNLHPDLLRACQSRIKQQRTFDKKSLGVGVCYRCGHVLWTTVDGAHTFLVDKPSNMTSEDAPAAYLRAVPNCTLSFEYTQHSKPVKGCTVFFALALCACVEDPYLNYCHFCVIHVQWDILGVSVILEEMERKKKKPWRQGELNRRRTYQSRSRVHCLTRDSSFAVNSYCESDL